MAPQTRSSAPRARMQARLISGVGSGTTMVVFTPSWLPARAQAMPWLPEEAAMILISLPYSRISAVILLTAPRNL